MPLRLFHMWNGAFLSNGMYAQQHTTNTIATLLVLSHYIKYKQFKRLCNSKVKQGYPHGVIFIVMPTAHNKMLYPWIEYSGFVLEQMALKQSEFRDALADSR